MSCLINFHTNGCFENVAVIVPIQKKASDTIRSISLEETYVDGVARCLSFGNDGLTNLPISKCRNVPLTHRNHGRS